MRASNRRQQRHRFRDCKGIPCRRSRGDYHRTHDAALQEAKEKLSSDRLHTMVWDVSDVKSIPQKLQEATNLLAGKNIDIFINNAGVYVPENLDEYDERTYDSIMATNTKGLFFTCQAEKKYFINKRH